MNFYDLQQVCLNGHQVTDVANQNPEACRAHCPQCGAKTIVQCPECGSHIPGFYHVLGVLSPAETPVPNNCGACGTAYPWRQEALAAAVEILQMGLEGQDAEDAAALVPAIASETPRTELSAIKLKRLMGKMGKPAYDVAIKVISDLASETAKKTLGMK